MTTYTTLEQIADASQSHQTGPGSIRLRKEQREAIDRAKRQFCKRSGKKGAYEYELLPSTQQFLWNAKMRFGKTICALQLAREIGAKRILIVTHRPVVGEGWLRAFKQTYGDTVEGNDNIRSRFGYGTRSKDQASGASFYELEKKSQTEDLGYVFFVSMQYLRLSELVNEKTALKNKEKESAASAENEKLKAAILGNDWDLIVIDEAHEGTKTSLGKDVIDKCLRKDKTKMLHLSGTPFNLYDDFEPQEIFNWDYMSEQTEKNNWAINHPGEPNPYAELPQLKILTYDITKTIDNILDQTGIFTFQEFFRTWTGNPRADKADMPEGKKGDFVHEDEVQKFLNLLCTKNTENNFPFSTDEYRNQFRHTFWVVSHVNEAKALERLLKRHPIFKKFKIVNVAGDSAEDEESDTALDKVKTAIGELPEKTMTITISCGRLTTGVTVEPWSAVLYLKGGEGASTYMQTIFRVQSPYTTKDGRMKTSCYVFDFSPDRTLKVIAYSSKFTAKARSIEEEIEKKEKSKKDKDQAEEGSIESLTAEQREKAYVKEFVELCPILNMEGGKMSPLDVGAIYKQLENVFIDRLVRKGFDDPCLYVQEELNKIDADLINHIGENGGQAPDETRKEAKAVVDLSHMTPEQRAEYEKNMCEKLEWAKKMAEAKAKKDAEFQKWWESATDEERQKYLDDQAKKEAEREEAKKRREEFKKRITNIRGIALRIPLLMYGGADAGDTSEDITVDNFTRKIKDESWTEFMPKGITKEDFNKIRKCFNATRFEEAGRKYRALTREADFMHVDERIRQITEIFSYFRNPDKETVLTPWRVVNMHMSDTLGGYCFFDETFDEKDGALDEPRYVERGDVTDLLFNRVDLGGEVPTKILEINSKTGLYPLYVTYSLYRRRLQEYVAAQCIDPETVSVEEEQVVWDDIVADNMYVICNTPMAAGITRRTLFGFREVEKKAHIRAEKLIEKAKNDQENLVAAIKSEGFWNGTNSKRMIQFDAVVGNPPYQMENGDGNRKEPVYHFFYDCAFSISGVATLITPGRFLFNTGQTPSDWNRKILQDRHFSVARYIQNSQDVFPSVDIKGGIAISYRNTGEDFGPIGVYTIFEELNSIAKKVKEYGEFKSFSELIYTPYSYKFTPYMYESNPGIQDYLGNYDSLRSNIFDRVPQLFHNLKPTDGEEYVQIYGIQNAKRTYKWIRRDFINQHVNLDKYKVFVPEANGSGAIGEILSTPVIGQPVIGHTQSFISIGAFDSEKESEAVLKYVKSKFARTLLSVLKATQHNNKDSWLYVPLQDFTSESDIDWGKSVAEIDRQLYMKYGLDMFEIQFIEEKIKPME